MSIRFAPFCHPISRQRGVAAVEFAIVVFILLLIGAGLVEFGRALWYYDALAKGTRDAARYLSVVPAATLASESATAKDIVAQAATAAFVPDFTTANVSVACVPAACVAVTEVTVTATFPMTLGALFPFVASDSQTFAVTLQPHTTMPYLW